jgi:hypothetical protein
MTLGVVALVAAYLMTGPIDYKAVHPTWDILYNYPRLLGGWIVFVALLMPQRAHSALTAEGDRIQTHTAPMSIVREPSVS